jgi:PAS domain S-box-containing protein
MPEPPETPSTLREVPCRGAGEADPPQPIGPADGSAGGVGEAPPPYPPADAQPEGGLKKAGQSPRESQELYRAVFEHAAVGVAQVEMATGRYLTVNRRLCEITGRTEEELLASTVPMITHPDDLQLHREKMDLLAAGKIRDYSLAKRYLWGDGTVVWVNVSVSPLWKSGEAPSRCLILVQDITERRQIEEALQQAHARIALLINSISSILIVISEEQWISFWNTEAEKQFGVPEGDALGRTLGSLGIKWDLGRVAEGIVRCQREGRSVELEDLSFVQVDGTEGVLALKISCPFGQKAFGMATLLQGANITRRRILEGQLIQAQKMESIGQLAAGIAHEINTPTQYVGDNVRFLQESFGDLQALLAAFASRQERVRGGQAAPPLPGELQALLGGVDLAFLNREIPRAFEQTLEGVERVSRIVQSIRAFAHPGQQEKVPYDINKAVENALLVARNEWKYVAEAAAELDPLLPRVHCVPGDINQVLLNILVNAAQAVSEATGGGAAGKGRITISTRRDGSWVEIRISDTGRGIPADIRPKIFDLFFTTKEVGRGTGQGLAISYAAVVERHHGALTFETEVGRGTTFIVRLPIGPGDEGGAGEG